MPHIVDFNQGWNNNKKGISVDVFGRNEAVGNAYEDLWFEGGMMTWPTSGSQISIVSTSPDDSEFGIGAQRVEVEGLDINCEPIVENLALNGTTPVLTTKEFFRVEVCFVTQWGSDIIKAPLGIIRGTHDSAGVQFHLPTGINLTAKSQHTVPLGKRVLIRSLEWGTTGSKAIIFTFQFRKFGFEGWYDLRIVESEKQMIRLEGNFLLLEEKDEIRVLAKSTVGSTQSVIAVYGLEERDK